MPKDFLDDFLDTPETQEINQIVATVMESGKPIDLKKEVESELPYTRRVRLNDIVPEEYQMQLMQIDFTLSHCYWLIGDIADRIISSVNRQRAQELGRVITNTDVYDAVGYFCHRTGRTVRYYWEVAHFFQAEIRERYDVQFAVWAEARWADSPEEVLQIASDNPQMSVQAVRTEYYKRRGLTPPTAPKVDRAEDSTADGGAELPLPEAGEQWTGEAQPRFKHTMIAKLDSTIDQLRQTADRIPLPTEIRTRIGDVLLELQDIVLEMRRIA